jgi:hypothetical protein
VRRRTRRTETGGESTEWFEGKADPRDEEMAREWLATQLTGGDDEGDYFRALHGPLVRLLAQARREERDRCVEIVREVEAVASVPENWWNPAGTCREILRRLGEPVEGNPFSIKPCSVHGLAKTYKCAECQGMLGAWETPK